MRTLTGTYRAAAASLVLTLLFSVTMPLIQHACAMAGARASLSSAACCCGKDAAHHGDPSSETSCHDEPGPAQHSAQAHEEVPSGFAACCSVDVQQADLSSTVPSKQVHEHRSVPALLILAEAVLQQAERPRPPLLFDAGPSAFSPVPLHLLHVVLLN